MSPHHLTVVLRGGKPAREKWKVCAGCGQRKLVSDDLGVSEFGPAHRDPDGNIKAWLPRCRPCWREHHAQGMREWRRQHVDTNREIQRRYRASRDKRQPGWRAEQRRSQLVQAAEREGKVVPISLAKRKHETKRMLPIAPFRAWLKAYQKRTRQDRGQLAFDLGFIDGANHTGVRRLWAMMDDPREKRVSMDVVDRALILASATLTITVAGRPVITLEDLYSEKELAA